MDSAELLAKLDALSVWTRGDERAPHKPLLLLVALGHLQGGDDVVPFTTCEKPLRELLQEFGPTRSSYHPEYPFWRLQSDGLWEVRASRPLVARQSSTNPPVRELRDAHAVGSFPAPIRDLLRANPLLVAEFARRLLEAHFPESLHTDILDAVGLSLAMTTQTRRKRDSTFRERVLLAYGYQCALCGLDLRIGRITIALEAAHIRWHQAGGPDAETNGFALCPLHHKLFDLGAFTVLGDLRVLVSEHANGQSGFRDALGRHHGGELRQPHDLQKYPAAHHLGWHRREVFKEKPLSLPGNEGR